jgi:hypothetical protein
MTFVKGSHLGLWITTHEGLLGLKELEKSSRQHCVGHDGFTLQGFLRIFLIHEGERLNEIPRKSKNCFVIY